MPLVSVIVPVFGVEKYIERCVRSLMLQTLNDVEFIFVNDCTQDSSMAILQSVLEKFPSRRDQVYIINHEQNMGLPAARQSGLKKATGKYILHCDSDDWLELNCCEVAFNIARNTDADIVVFKYWIDNGESRFEDNSYNDSYLAVKDMAMSSAISLSSSPYVWNKLVKNTIYDNSIEFPKYNLAEDWVLSVQFARYSRKTVCIEDRLYHYFRSQSSIMGNGTVDAYFKRCADDFANVTLICKWLNENDLLNKFKWEVVKRKTVSKNHLLPIICNKQASKRWRRTFPEINFNAMLCPYFDMRYKVKYLMLVIGLYRPYRILRHYISAEKG